jgi:hypothetical protein
MLWRLHVVAMYRAACRVSAGFSRLCFRTARDTRKHKTAKQNRKYSHVSNCPAFAIQTASCCVFTITASSWLHNSELVFDLLPQLQAKFLRFLRLTTGTGRTADYADSTERRRNRAEARDSRLSWCFVIPSSFGIRTSSFPNIRAIRGFAVVRVHLLAKTFGVRD